MVLPVQWITGILKISELDDWYDVPLPTVNSALVQKYGGLDKLLLKVTNDLHHSYTKHIYPIAIHLSSHFDFIYLFIYLLIYLSIC